MHARLPSVPAAALWSARRLQLWSIVAAVACTFFASAALRHFMFHSTAYDLGIFDQATYLMSVGAAPISSFLGFHILGDHGAPIWYALALPYIVWPSPYCLLLIQALALALAAWPLRSLARREGLADAEAMLLVGCYWLYPVVFNANLADFHPDTLAVPALFGAVLAARRDQVWLFCGCVAFILSCKSVLGLSVCAMGVWLCLSKDLRFYGIVAVVAGMGWFALVNELLLPLISGQDAAVVAGDGRYAYLGASLAEILKTLLMRPWTVVGRLVSVSAVGYLIGLTAPLLWGLRLRHCGPLLGAAPILLLNLLSDLRLQRHLTNQYSLAVIPFLFFAVLAAMAAGQAWVRDRRRVWVWAALGFAIFARYPRLIGYLENLDTLSAQREAVHRVDPDRSVVADSCFVPHLAHRSYINTLDASRIPTALPADVHYVLINERRPCEMSVEEARRLALDFRAAAGFQVLFEKDGIVLFGR